MKWLKSIILSWLVRNLFHGIGKDDIIQIVKGEATDKAFCRGIELPIDRMIQIQKEADYIENSLFWREVCDRGIRYTAQEKGISGARVDGDLWLAQGMILDLDIIKQAIKDIKDFKIGKVK